MPCLQLQDWIRAAPLQLSLTAPPKPEVPYVPSCLGMIFCHPQPWDGPGYLLCQGSLGTQGTLSRELAAEEVSRGEAWFTVPSLNYPGCLSWLITPEEPDETRGPRRGLSGVQLLPWPPKALGLHGTVLVAGMLTEGQDCHLLLSRSQPQDWGHPSHTSVLVGTQSSTSCPSALSSSGFSMALGGLACPYTP